MNSKELHKTKAFRKRHAARMRRHVKQHGWWILLLLFLLAVVAFQVWYPQDRTLPLARYNHDWYGWKTSDELVAREQTRFASTQVELQAGFGMESVELVTIGATLKETASFTELRRYSELWRWVPFSILWYRPNVTELQVTYAAEPLQEFVRQYATRHAVVAEDATITIGEDGQVEVKDGSYGREIVAEELSARLQAAPIDTSGVVRVAVPERAIEPDTQAMDMSELRAQAEAVLAKKISISVAGREQTFAPSREEIAEWLVITNQAEELRLVLSPEKLAEYAAAIDGQVARAPGQTVVRYVDGSEASREVGEVGEQINRGDFEQKMSSVLQTPGQYKYVTALLEPVAPLVQEQYAYSHSQVGLQAKMNDIGRRYNVRMSLQQLDGPSWKASYRGGESTPSASTYKLYVAIRLFRDIAAGNTNWSSPMLHTDTAGCFEQMIAISTNQCAEEWLRQFGRDNVNNFLYERGISRATSFTTGGAVQTSADDLVRVVRGIHDGSLASGGERERLLSTMSRQIWRKGIPTGTAGWAQNKVGFLWDYVHDTGVVYHPRGTYVVAIMTKGASYDIIAQITRELEAQMYP